MNLFTELQNFACLQSIEICRDVFILTLLHPQAGLSLSSTMPVMVTASMLPAVDYPIGNRFKGNSYLILIS